MIMASTGVKVWSTKLDFSGDKAGPVMDRSRRYSSSSPLKGHMALNSSVYKPSVNKLSTQHLIQDQMASHYYNLATMKSAIDTTPPKSMALSIKKRDQVKRDAVIKHMKTQAMQRRINKPPNQGRNGHNLVNGADQRRIVERYSVEESASSGSVDLNQPRKFRRHEMLTSRSWAPANSDELLSCRPASAGARPMTTGRLKRTDSLKQSGGNSAKPNILEITYSGDYLEKHSERFKNCEKTSPFTPRTKKRKGAKSFLAQSDHYAPPTLHPRKEKSGSRKKDRQETMTEENLESFNHSQTPEREEHHRRWIEEQTDLVQRLTLEENEPPPPSRSSGRSWLHTATMDKTRPGSRSSEAKSETQRRIEAEEEEAKYLRFISDVTSDILSRGIYSDAVINQMMERHVQQRSHDLSVKKMRKMLKNLKEDLGLSDNLPSTSNELTTSKSYERYSLLGTANEQISDSRTGETRRKIIDSDSSDRGSVTHKLRGKKPDWSRNRSATTTPRSAVDTGAKSGTTELTRAKVTADSIDKTPSLTFHSLKDAKAAGSGNESAVHVDKFENRLSVSKRESIEPPEIAPSLASVSSLRSMDHHKKLESLTPAEPSPTAVESKPRTSIPRSPSVSSVSSTRLSKPAASPVPSEAPVPVKRSLVRSVQLEEPVEADEKVAEISSFNDETRKLEEAPAALGETTKSSDTAGKSSDAQENESEASDYESVAALSMVMRPQDRDPNATSSPPDDEHDIAKDGQQRQASGKKEEEAEDDHYSDDFSAESGISDGDF